MSLRGWTFLGHRKWPRALCGEDLCIVMSWPTLAEKEPEIGQICKYRIVAAHLSGKTETGTWAELLSTGEGGSFTYQRMFQDERGIVCADHKQVYWTPL